MSQKLVALRFSETLVWSYVSIHGAPHRIRLVHAVILETREDDATGDILGSWSRRGSHVARGRLRA